MDYFIDVEPGKQPTLAEMTHAAITRLQRESNGFVLLVEGGFVTPIKLIDTETFS